jgi:nitroreductase
MAAMIILLGAVDAGLGACFFGVPAARVDTLAAEFAVPAGLTPVGVISLGYPAPDRKSPSLRRGRRGIDEVVSFNGFG